MITVTDDKAHLAALACSQPSCNDSDHCHMLHGHGSKGSDVPFCLPAAAAAAVLFSVLPVLRVPKLLLSAS